MDQPEPARKPLVGGRPREPVVDVTLEVEPEPRTRPDALPPPPPPRPRPFARLIAPGSVRRASPRGWALVAAGLVAAVVVVGMLGVSLVHRVLDFVRAQPAYQVSHREVVLEPPVPRWFKGGREAFLDHVWEGSVEPRRFSALDLDGPRLLTLFKRNPWVRRAGRVKTVGYPNRVLIELDYREPVAVARLPRGVKVPIDAEGVLLPADQIELEAAEPLVWLDRFPPPAEPRLGEVWNRREPGKGIVAEARAVAAARLAGFLKGRMGELPSVLPPPFYLHLLPYEPTGLYLQLSCGDKLMVCWDDPEAEPPVRKLDAAAKWAMLLDELRRHPPARTGQVVYLHFTRGGLAFDPRQDMAPTTGLRDRNPRTKPTQVR